MQVTTTKTNKRHNRLTGN